MFYSDTLLSKTGPLAHVWLAANIERKLSKKDIMHSDLEDSVEVMVGETSAPMALRLSGQLLLGVVRIYKRKAGYLLDDCNEALLKIKMAFRPGNVDLPADQSHIANADSLNLPDRITEVDLFAVLGDPDLLLSQPLKLRKANEDPGVLDWGTQDIITDSLDIASTMAADRILDDEGLDLDLGLGEDDYTLDVGRHAPTPRNNLGDEPTLLPEDELDLDIGNDFQVGDISGLPQLEAQDVPMDDLALDTTIDLGPDLPAPAPLRNRDDLSPLSDLRPSLERELEQSFRPNETSLYDHADETVVEAAQRVKRRKVIAMDTDLELPNALIMQQQTDRSKILKQAAFLPRDPMLLALLNMQKNGGFVSNIFGDGRSMGWAPELRGVLSVDLIRSSGDLKRKRDSGVADLYSDEEQQEKEAAAEDELQAQENFERLPSDGAVQGFDNDPEGDMGPGTPLAMDNFDDTTIPLVHPAESGPISQGTQHAVHALREHFGPEGEDSPRHRQKSSVLLQDLLPEKQTSRRDATKMFFEVLVLATKDAIKVEQDTKKIGGPIRIRAKRGLYGSWAETGEAAALQQVDAETEAVDATA